MKRFTMSLLLWWKLINGLRIRGSGKRESGAFLLKPANASHITKIVFYDELDPNVSNSGIIILDGSGKVKLWELLQQWGMEVAADIHTHPVGCSTAQSLADQHHPMVKIKGHVALIAPNYARNWMLMPKNCSAYSYEGNFRWTSYKDQSPIKITLP